MKEPAVVINMQVVPTSNNNIVDTNIAAGVIVSDLGPVEPTLWRDSTEFLKAYTPTGTITKTTDPTVIHAYALSKALPVLVARAYQGSKETKSGKAIISTGAVQSQKVFKKDENLLLEVTPLQFSDYLEPGHFCLQVGNIVYRDGPLVGTLPVGVSDLLVVVADVGTPLESFIFAVNQVVTLFQLELNNESTDTGSGYFANLQLYGLVGTTVPDSKYSNSSYTYNWLSVSSINESLVVLYLFANSPSVIDFTGAITAASTITDLITLKVTTPSKTYEYEGSLNEEYINPYGKNQFIENINVYAGIEFEVMVGEYTTNNFTLTSPIPFGSMAKATKSLISTNYTDALNDIMDDDRYSPAYLCALGYNNDAYLNSLTTWGEAKWAFVPNGIIVKSKDPEVIKANQPSPRSSQFLCMAPHEVNTSLGNFATNLSLEVAYITRIQVNKGRGSEFAPMMGETNSTLVVDGLSAVLSKSTRESLLDNNIMSVLTKGANKYFNKNKSTSSVDDIIAQEQNQRLANKINRDIDQLMTQFLGQFNTISTRSRATTVLNNYFNTQIMNQNFTLNRVTVTCNDTNNPASVITNGQLAVTINGVYESTIYEVTIYHRVFDLSNAA